MFHPTNLQTCPIQYLFVEVGGVVVDDSGDLLLRHDSIGDHLDKDDNVLAKKIKKFTPLFILRTGETRLGFY